MNKRLLLLLLVPILFLSGCSREIELQTYADEESIPNGFPKGTSFYIFTDLSKDRLLAKEVTKKIANALKDSDYKVADKYSAQYFLFFNYDLQVEKQIRRVPTPVGHTIVNSSGQAQGYSQGHISGSNNGFISGDINGSYHENHSSNFSCNNSAYYQDQTSATQIAYVPQEFITFNKAIVLQVYDASVYRNSQKEEKIWQSVACNFDKDGDLRSTINFLLLASFQYFGKNTQKFVRVSLKNNDKNIKKLTSSCSTSFEYKEIEYLQDTEYSSKIKKLTENIKDSLNNFKNETVKQYNNFFSRTENKTSKPHHKRKNRSKLI